MDVDQRRRSRAAHAALVGGVGTVSILLAYQAIPQILSEPSLSVRQPQGLLFLFWVFIVGAAGGAVGHRMFLSRESRLASEHGQLFRAVWVGLLIGASVALIGWSVTFLLRGVLFPFEPFPGMDRMMLGWLRNALIAGPLAGAVISAIVASVIELGTADGDETRMGP